MTIKQLKSSHHLSEGREQIEKLNTQRKSENCNKPHAHLFPGGFRLKKNK